MQFFHCKRKLLNFRIKLSLFSKILQKEVEFQMDLIIKHKLILIIFSS